MFVSLLTLATLRMFVDCMAGPETRQMLRSECLAAFDYDANGRVDLRDFAFLQNQTETCCERRP